MLKFNYGKQGTVLEAVADPIEDVINRHIMLAMRLAQPIHMEPSFVSLIVPPGVPELKALELELAQVNCDAVAVDADARESDDPKEFISGDFPRHGREVIMRGFWLTEHPDAEEGIFVTSLTSGIEAQIEELWTYQPITFP
ncbi:hypothetical protein [Acaryochloris sp. IP29b_bin.137]|uniref:hypothetical protein n=1 Tax=Acaryochloris sp. IP29b_bin.137 TaxID=2969217 RepID=UPI002601C12E|nr:hypothetical protein [Acaryochloris sp. IP29b_bin.137]